MNDNQNIFDSFSLRLSDSSEEIRYQAVKDLVEQEVPMAIPFLIKMLGDDSFRIREEVQTTICSFPVQIIFPKLKEVLEHHPDARSRSSVMEIIPQYGEDATPYLLDLLNSPDEKVRMYSVLMLGKIEDSESVDELIKILTDDDSNVVHCAIETLGFIGDGRANCICIEIAAFKAYIYKDGCRTSAFDDIG